MELLCGDSAKLHIEALGFESLVLQVEFRLPEHRIILKAGSQLLVPTDVFFLVEEVGLGLELGHPGLLVLVLESLRNRLQGGGKFVVHDPVGVEGLVALDRAKVFVLFLLLFSLLNAAFLHVVDLGLSVELAEVVGVVGGSRSDLPNEVLLAEV